jgi:uncharacterized protein (DUF305 family)
MKLRYVAGALAVLLTIAVTALAQHHGGHDTMTPADIQKMVEDMMPKPSDPASTRAFKEAHMKMMKGMHVPFTGNANVDFTRGMIPHHQGAIDMAKVVLAHGSDREIKALAQKIIDDQTREIAQMEAWLRKNAK